MVRWTRSTAPFDWEPVVEHQVLERLRERVEPEALADGAVVAHPLGWLQLGEVALDDDALNDGRDVFGPGLGNCLGHSVPPVSGVPLSSSRLASMRANRLIA